MPKITKTTIDEIQSKQVDVWRWDSTLPGFGVRVTPNDRRTYVIRYRTADGQQRKHMIGRCSDLAPDRARDLARKLFGEIAAGHDPSSAKRDRLTAPDMTDLWERYLKEHAKPFKKPVSVAHDVRNWNMRVAPWLGKKKIEAVTKADINALHASLSIRPVTANHARALLSKMFNLAIEWGWRDKTNPCIGVKKYKSKQRELILTPAQLVAMDKAITDLVERKMIMPQFGDLFRLLAMTGCRLNEIQSARRDWVDMERRLLLLPDSKVGQRRINLPEAAIKLIQAMPPNKWLIPGKIGNTHMTQPHAAWDRVVAHADLPPETRLHDLRHTFGSLGHRAGLSQRQIADMLGHRNLATTERYLHGYVEDTTVAVDKVSGLITAGWSV